MAEAEDPFDRLLGLEDEFYKEGFDVGVKDGKRAGMIDGRLFGLENGFQKYVAMGRLHGRARVWAGRMSQSDQKPDPIENTLDENISQGNDDFVTRLDNPRLKTHVRTLYALTEPSSIATENSESAVADFDDRLKRAVGKAKVIKKLTGELDQDYNEHPRKDAKAKGDGEIEDTSVLNARH